MSAASLARDIEAAIRAEAGGRRPAPATVFNKPGDEYVSYGIRAPDLYRIFRAFKQPILALTLEQRLDLALRLLGRRIGEPGHAGIHVLRLSARELTPRDFPALQRAADDFIGWSHVDDFCDGVLQPLLAAHPAATLRLLRRWSRSPNRWLRRASVVAFTRKAGESGLYTGEVIALCERLAFDPDDLVRKGAGWALKDCLRGDRERIIPFIKDLRRRGAPAVVTLYAIRDLKGAQRENVLAIKRES
jgi:3-methyladenine DNA glycosylase AlkD